jgi:hypothetical protein
MMRVRYLPLIAQLLEMIGAMALGMVVLPPLMGFAARALPDSNGLQHLESVIGTTIELQALLMATAMVLPVTIWMHLRGHRRLVTLEMTLAMYAGFVLLFPMHWLGVINPGQLIMSGHLLMVVFMLLAILAHQREHRVAPQRGHVDESRRRGEKAPW